MGRVEEYLKERVVSEGAIHITLIDPERGAIEKLVDIACRAEKAGTAAIMIGSSTLASPLLLDELLKELKPRLSIPTIIFPNNIVAITRLADAIWFMSLLNSDNPYFITGAQALAAPIVKRYGLEAIPMGYIVMGKGGAAGFIGCARPIPYEKPEIAAAYALAAQLLGMRFVYLEAGSGVRKPIPPEVVRMVRATIDVPLIVGGGLRTAEQIEATAAAGANIIVTGTIVEQMADIEELIDRFVEATVKGAGRYRRMQ
ncbi:MAG: geranylgeranylglyceryl/heptaprenylglyceryl phosphate synthase [Nitrososphaerota archaeon]|nr:geranylgeranylglyceryl/heptaprenylglyceryl phosphate synthase [Candidatus Bathyarchaeota archaeon]MDW8061350.1 geranylgeranylglyceryl/heptaprenylglyceryl phosphate synthase [Nitrososphaerota archaeon]